MTGMQMFWTVVQVILVAFLLIFGVGLLVSLFFLLRMMWQERGSTYEPDLDDEDGLLVFDYSKDDPWKCGRCGREFEDRRGYNEPRKHYQYHHRSSVRAEEYD